MSRAEWPELGRDELDRPTEDGRRRVVPPWSALTGTAALAPTLLFVALGAALGPHGIGIFSREVLGHLEPIVWVALAVIGVFLGLSIAAVTSRSTPRLLAAGLTAPLLTIAVVGGGAYLLVAHSNAPLTGDPVGCAILIGVCTSVSAALAPGTGARGELQRAAHLADLDDLLLLACGVAVVAVLAADATPVRLVVTILTGAAIGVAGWLLFEHADEAERGVFVTGAVLLLAGIGAYLGTSPLLAGGAAAMVWAHAPGEADRITARDLRTLQHPLVALLLMLAGATLDWTPMVLWMTGAIVVLRLAGRLLASVVIAPIVDVSPALVATVMLRPGIMGIALALNAGVLLGADYAWLVSAVTTSALVAEVLAAFLPYEREDA